MERDIKLEIHNTLKKLGGFSAVAGLLLLTGGIFAYLNFPASSIFYFIIPGIIPLVAGIIFYTGYNDCYIIRPASKDILYYRSRLYSKVDEKILFNQIKRVEVEGKRVLVMEEQIHDIRGRNRRTPRHYYWWFINVRTEDGRVLRLTDEAKGESDGPPYGLDEEAGQIGKIIGCPAVISAHHLGGDMEIYNP